MKQKQELPGSTPNDENCAQVGTPDYDRMAKIEAIAYIGQLRRFFKRRPHGLRFAIERHLYQAATFQNPHDQYITTVAIVYDEVREDQVKACNRIMENLPEIWDNQARAELNSNNEYDISVVDYNSELAKAIHLIEQSGGFVLIDEARDGEAATELLIDDPLDDIDLIDPDKVIEEQEKSTRISVQKAIEQFGYDDYLDCFADITMDVINAPACCIHGCEVEPDGNCVHGNPSVLLAEGMI